ncbi:MAG TPA: hypothetical protein VMW04_00570 [Patescibacteria group bacterium]|nr:hypothetical protein [Patescibacteria group bacterium]
MDDLAEYLVNTYSRGGSLENWSSSLNEEEIVALSKVIQGLSLPLSGNDKIRILSPASNNASVEKRLRSALGDPYQLVCGDIAKLQSGGNIPYLRFDAREAPFASGSFSLIYDFFGATRYEPRVLEEYFRLLVFRGGVLFDNFTYTDQGTDAVLKSMGNSFSEPERFSLSDQCEVYFVRRN